MIDIVISMVIINVMGCIDGDWGFIVVFSDWRVRDWLFLVDWFVCGLL